MLRRAAGREGRCRQMSLACVGSTRSFPATLGLPPLGVCVCAFYIAQAPGCYIGSGLLVACGSSFGVLHKSTHLVGPTFCASPGLSSLGGQEFHECTLPGCSAPYPLSGPSLSFHMCRSGAPCICSGELVSSHDPPGGCQPSRISGSLWLETGRLFAVW